MEDLIRRIECQRTTRDRGPLSYHHQAVRIGHADAGCTTDRGLAATVHPQLAIECDIRILGHSRQGSLLLSCDHGTFADQYPGIVIQHIDIHRAS